MRKLRREIQVTMVLGILSLVSGVLVHLALTDIYHGEADVSLEWNVVRAGAVVFLAFISACLITLSRILKRL